MSRPPTWRLALLDSVLLCGLGVLAILGFRTTYTGWSFLLVGLAGLGIGLAVSQPLCAVRQRVIVVAAALVLAFFAFGGPLVLPDDPMVGIATVRDLGAASVLGWKELLTTVPPVDGTGPLLVVPYLLGLLCGATGTVAAHRIVRPRLLSAAAPPIAPALTLMAVIVFGTKQPGAQLLDGVVFALLCLCWTALRLHRSRPPVRHGARRLTRALAGGAVLGIAAVGAIGAAPVLPGARPADRDVLRDKVIPPFDIGAYPSPLVGFRKYTRDANQLWDQTLFTVTGLPDGATVRIAALDDYDGSVWGATNSRGGFQRVGARIATSGTGTPVTVRVTIAPAYASATDLNPWLPNAGTISGIDFAGDRRRGLADSFRFNLATSSGVVTARLRAGDSYTLRTVPATPTLPADAQPYGRPELTDSAQALLNSRVAGWTKGATGLGGQLRAVAAYLHNSGAYSDGGPGETQYLPGHGTGRLSTFLGATLPVGDDEQYAAAYALAANYLGIPARVVLGAKPQAGGVVRGSDVHAWVEVHLATGAWVPIPQTEFMPDTSKKPDQQPPQEVDNADAAVVPPPNPAHQPVSTVDPSRTESNQRQGDPRRHSWWQAVWAYLRPVLTFGGPPVLAVLLTCGSILGLKARRRHRRRNRQPMANRYAGGWRELVDQARDLGARIPSGYTRQQEADALAGYGIHWLADAADLAVYGPADPGGEHVAGYWAQVDQVCRRMGRDAGRWRRLRARLSIRSLRRPRSTPAPVLGGSTR